MNVLMLGCSYKTTPIDLREKLAFDGPKLKSALDELESRYGCEAVILSTCNRVEVYIARNETSVVPNAELLVEFLAEFHRLPVDQVRSCVYTQEGGEAIRHLYRVVSSLDSLVLGEGQIAGQVQKAYEVAYQAGSAGALLNTLFQCAQVVAKRVRTQTGITKGRVSVSSVAVDFVRQVFDRFDDKTVLVIGAGKMGELTLKHLKELKPQQILVTNRSPEKAIQVAQGCAGKPVPWEQLDDALVQADIVLSTTGAPEPIMPRRRFDPILARRTAGTMVILDIAVPRDFDPRIHDGDRACLFNIDDLQKVREQTIKERQKHIAPAESIIETEIKKFLSDWAKRRNGPIIAKLTKEFDTRRHAIVGQLMQKLNGKLNAEERKYVEGAFRLWQNQLLHGPISALAEEGSGASQHTLLEALSKLFRLES